MNAKFDTREELIFSVDLINCIQHCLCSLNAFVLLNPAAMKSGNPSSIVMYGEKAADNNVAILPDSPEVLISVMLVVGLSNSQ